MKLTKATKLMNYGKRLKYKNGGITMDMEKIMLLFLGVMANNFTEQIKAEVVPAVKAQIRNQFQQEDLPTEARLLILDVMKQVAVEMKAEYTREAAEE